MKLEVEVKFIKNKMKKNVLALDIGGTKIFCGRYDENLNLEDFFEQPTEAQSSKEKTLENILKTIQKVRNEETQSIGISWAGMVNGNKGKILKAPNIPNLDNFKICEFLEKETGLKTFLKNDSQLFALAEQKESAPKSTSFLGLIVGTGVGSGIILNGKIFSGNTGFAGEVGHIIVGKNEIENIISGPAIAKVLQTTNLQEISVDLKNKKEISKKIKPQIEAFGIFLASISLIINPEKIVIGGGAGIHFWQNFKSEILKVAEEKLQKYPVKIDLEFSELKNAGARGAAILAWEGGR